MSLLCFAPAKINLCLHVGAPRADGFHPLESLVTFAHDAGDVVSAVPAGDLSLVVTGQYGAALADEADNLILRAARILAAHAGITPRGALTLDKRLPVASGLGGGSADAAATLNLLNALWSVRASPADLERVAAALGSDAPVCVQSRPRHMRGRGEILTDIELPELHGVLVNPGVAVATAEVFRVFDAQGVFKPIEIANGAPIEAMRNDLEPAACALAPAIGEALALLRRTAPGAFVRMSGSGATCYALVADAATARRVADALAAAQPGWWVQPTRLGTVGVRPC